MVEVVVEVVVVVWHEQVVVVEYIAVFGVVVWHDQVVVVDFMVAVVTKRLYLSSLRVVVG